MQNHMTEPEILKLFRGGYSIEMLSKKEWNEQKEARTMRQINYQQESAYIKRMKAKDKKYKPQSRIIVGKPCTKFMALSIVEHAIYDDLMNQKGKK